MDLAALKEKIRAIEWQDHRSSAVFSFGVPSIDQSLPQGGLALGALHEWTGPYKSATLAVCAGLLGRLAKSKGPILWCAPKIDLNPQGLSAFGLLAHEVLYATSEDPAELLWAMEEGLKSHQLGAVFGEVSSLSLAFSRRLQLCAQKSGVAAMVLLPQKAKGSAMASTRWRVVPQKSTPAAGLWREDGVGDGQWRLELLRCRGGLAQAQWDVTWDESVLSFNLFTESCKRQERAAS